MWQVKVKPYLHYTRLNEIDQAVTGMKYKLVTPRRYYSERYSKWVYLEFGYLSDGATGAFDIHSWGWWIHDKLCATGVWEDGTPVNNFQASSVLGDILASERRYFRSVYWWGATWLFGGDKARDNGMW